tara:strand:+ start:611 stop:940 length:330 start_codon:yes stop_codon:yes gene_type:complete
MAIQKKKKLTYTDMMGVLNQMAQTITTVETLSNHYGKILDDYILFQDNKDLFIQYLEEKYKSEEETEDATEENKEGEIDKANKEKLQERQEVHVPEEIDDTDNKNTEDK